MAAKWEVIEGAGETPDPAVTGQASKSDALESAGLAILMASLKALSARAVEALSKLFTLATVASAFYLWYLTPEPNVLQIVSLTIYALFVLAANWLVRR
jgi:hypothetical protein